MEGIGSNGIIEIAKGEQMDLMARRPPHVAASVWHVGERLREVAEGKPRKPAFSSLSPAEQEAACAEFLRERHPDRRDLPVIKRLLQPVGRGLEDVDVYGVAEDGTLVYAQVTNHRVDSNPASKKVARLSAYRGAYANEGAVTDVRGLGVCLVFFGVGETTSKAEGVSFVAVDSEVESWILSDPDHRRGLFGKL